MSDEAIYEERARNQSVRAMVQEIRQLERERDAIAEIVAGAGLDSGLLQWRVESVVKQRDEARAVARQLKAERDAARRWAQAFKMLAKENADLAAKLVIRLYGQRAGRDKPAEGE